MHNIVIYTSRGIFAPGGIYFIITYYNQGAYIIIGGDNICLIFVVPVKETVQGLLL